MADNLSEQLTELKKMADFGKLVLEAAKQAGFIPKRQTVKVRTVEKIKVVMRRPRRTKAEMAAARAAALGELTPTPELGDGPAPTSGSALDELIKK